MDRAGDRNLAAAPWQQHGPSTRSPARSGLVLVGDIELDGACRHVREVLVAMNGTARHVDSVAGLEHARRFALDSEGDFTLLHRPPLVTRMTVELIARPCRNDDRLKPHDAGRVFLER